MHSKSRGFTIVELLIVIVVIGILAAIVIVAFNGIQGRARDTERTAEVKSLQKAIELYKADKGEYPLHSGGAINTGYNITVLASVLVPTYISQIPSDPGTTNYQYVRGPVANDSYAIRVGYETKSPCRMGANATTTGWWTMSEC